MAVSSQTKIRFSHIIFVFHSMIQTQFRIKIKTLTMLEIISLQPYLHISDFKALSIILCVLLHSRKWSGRNDKWTPFKQYPSIAFLRKYVKNLLGGGSLSATPMINHFPSFVRNNLSLILVLNQFHPHFQTSNGLTPCIFGCTSTTKWYKCYILHLGSLTLQLMWHITEQRPLYSKASL